MLFQDTGEVVNMFEGKEKVIIKNFFKLNSFLTNLNYSKDKKSNCSALRQTVCLEKVIMQGMFYDFA